MQFEGIRAVVTGGASGLGLATAGRVIAAGGQALLLDVNADAGAAAVAALGPRACFRAVDVTDGAALEAALDDGLATLGGLDLAVSCAGVVGAGLTLGKTGPMPLEQFARTIGINLIGTFNLVRLAAVRMQGNAPRADGERGVIVNTASVAAFDGQIGQAAYSASKGGVVGMTLPLAREFARHGIRVMSIAPGLFRTPMLESLPESVQQSLGASVPFPPRLGDPAEYAALVQAIVENVLLNGETIRLDGAIRLAPK
ncbi:MAG: SDR family NAD(P)-dependent oxidoreductase [Immundisolibacter sp.]|uniref:SDR family NAD(P)-dependent oxidoreductase n=1 Tax=Immundisolibacter sp. TaxID=1934948 RepID=UPI001994489B|nr:SDR family NAD(P)-dependent oxidoreductase [Immundisolibacter sp.]MBC7161827.1 SDR family NAD(P)-dependent oxidoreductase [Immundisolibacter sp.]